MFEQLSEEIIGSSIVGQLLKVILIIHGCLFVEQVKVLFRKDLVPGIDHRGDLLEGGPVDVAFVLHGASGVDEEQALLEQVFLP